MQRTPYAETSVLTANFRFGQVCAKDPVGRTDLFHECSKEFHLLLVQDEVL